MVEEDQSAREAKATALAKAWEHVPQLRRAAKSFQLVLALMCTKGLQLRIYIFTYG